MRRRQVVALVGLAATGVAGCAGTPRPTPEPPEETPPPATDDDPDPVYTPTPELQGTDFQPTEGPDGDLVIDLTVYNPTESERKSRLLLTASAGETTRSATRNLTLAAGESQDLSVTIPLAHADWEARSSSLDFTFSER